MQLENYFEFFDNQDIRIKGTRIGIEIVVEDFLAGASPEEIAVRYPNLSLEQIYATITYYLANRQEVDAYIEAGWQEIEKAAQSQEKNPPVFIKHLRQLKAKGKHVPGMLLLKRRISISELIAELLLIWRASKPHEYKDHIRYLPL